MAVARAGPLAGYAGARQAAALRELAVIADLYDRGMREPLPLYCRTSAAYATAFAAGGDPLAAAARAWTSAYRFDGEDAEPEHELVLGGRVGFDALTAQPPGPGEDGAGWAMDDSTRLGRLARRLWDGLLACELLSEL